jgi:hypothetical protein
MPRRSAEDRAGAYARSGGKPPEPFTPLSPRAKQMWRDICRFRAADYWDAPAQLILGQFCELCAVQETNMEMLRKDPTNSDLQRVAVRMQATLNSCAVKLRLTPSAVLSKKAGVLSGEHEPETGPSDDTLFAATW